MLTIYKLARNTFVECIREPVYFLMLICALCINGLYPTAAMFVFREQIKFVVDSTMATSLVFSLVIAVVCSAHTISREMRNGTVLLLMSKPVTRFAFVAAKIFGIISAVTVFLFLLNCSALISVLIAKDQFRLEFSLMGIYYGALAVAAVYGGLRNYFKQLSFTSNTLTALLVLIPVIAVVFYIIRVSAFHSPAEIDPEEFIEARHLVPALLLLFPAAWTMGTISAALATRIELVSNLTICTVIFLLGLVSKFFVLQWVGTGAASSFLRTLLPNWQYFWMADAIAARQEIPASYILWALVYVIFYIGFWSLLALAFFNEREIAKDSR